MPSDTAADAPVTTEELTGFLRDMLLIRRFEEKAGQLYGMGLIGGFCHLYIGQEAVVTGLSAAARPLDRSITSYRSHGHLLACGVPPAAIMAELTGRASGLSGGKGGSMHMAAPERGFFGGHAIVGAQVPIGAGLAFADRYAGEDRVSFVYYGDGAAQQGQIAETYALAQMWNLPMVFVIENNRTASPGSPKQVELTALAAAHGIASEVVDGMDVLAVRQAGRRAAQRCRAGRGPALLEMRTHRYRGHSLADPAGQHSRDDTRRIRAERDPVEHVRRRLRDRGTGEDTLKRIDDAVREEIAEAARLARDAPEPRDDSLFDHLAMVQE
ncbi:thiamine pyrophosphate-dependent enzyme [Profundibacterium mesophilum]|uniref:Pyruvate dehydrogenase E1 component subunit alpha n=1 Tax=Profundibacterium mesophilum KAUST100406-0324 TaxID=1037889 RepID=A0A921TE31_9RHOB|nr:thiamine pyrophosphate-dependent enzyme [Profundibacterium mesophilum]KAF0677428.1 pyruvate dehydrogenase E1 component subunit alpha [Profundibacterium mesophilum KAUST100406-0324]